MKRLIILLTILALLFALAGCGSSSKQPAGQSQGSETKLVVGATAKPHAEILEKVKPILKKEGVDLQIKVFTDYVLLNPALKDGQIDANFFQHIPYLDDYNTKHHTKLTWSVKVHIEPMGVYSKKIKNLKELPNGATVGIPNDATNGGRALAVLEKAGLIKLKEGKTITATPQDIISNPKQLKVQMMDAAMLPRSLDDLTICVINSNYAIEAQLNPVKDSIFMEAKDSPYANVLAVRPEDKNKDTIKKLGAALQSPEVKKFLEEKYQGSCVPAF